MLFTEANKTNGKKTKKLYSEGQLIGIFGLSSIYCNKIDYLELYSITLIFSPPGICYFFLFKKAF